MWPVFTAFLPVLPLLAGLWERTGSCVFDISGLTLQQRLCKMGNNKNAIAGN
jgi:hypothetical protein